MHDQSELNKIRNTILILISRYSCLIIHARYFFLYIILILLVSCSSDTKNTKIIQPATLNEKKKEPLPIGGFQPEYFTITDSMLNIGPELLNCGGALSGAPLYKNAQNNWVLKYYRNIPQYIFLFYENDIPDGLLEKLDMELKGGIELNKEEKLASLPCFTKQGVELDVSYFTSIRGFHLGIQKEKAFKKLGEPSYITSEKNMEKIIWTYEINKQNNSRKKVNTSESEPDGLYSHSIEMFFEKNILKGMILYNRNP